MTWQLRHEWTPGANILGARLSTCGHCKTLRVDLGERRHFIQRDRDERKRVLELEPACVSPGREPSPA